MSPSPTTSLPPTPFSEAPWLSGHPSPYYTPSHHTLQRFCRAFTTEHLHAHAPEWEAAETVPEHVWGEFAAANMLLPNLPAPLPVEWLRRVGVERMPGGVGVGEWDYLHTCVYVSEMTRTGLQGPSGSLTTGFAFGIPPILTYGSPSLQDRFLPDLLLAKKRICIAITEPDAGSDVANIQTRAVRSEDGKSWIVNGSKKWITNALWSDYATMGVRTGGPGASGLSLLVVPLKGHPGVTMRRLHVQGQMSAGTTYIELDDVSVPIDNLIGEEGQGMKYIMKNFNHERLLLSIATTTTARTALSAAFAHTLTRRAFSAPLIAQPVVRHRLAKSLADLESTWSWLESVLFQMCHLSRTEADAMLGGVTALLKAKAGMVLAGCAECAVLLFGGMGYTRGGKGEVAERIWREVMGARIPGGSEDVLLDLAVRQAVKRYQVAVAEWRDVNGDDGGGEEDGQGGEMDAEKVMQRPVGGNAKL